MTREGAGRGFCRWATPSGDGPPVGQGFLSEMLHSAVAQKSEGSKNENKVGLCSSAINRKAFCLFFFFLSPEVTFGSLRRTSFKGVVVFIRFVF